MKLLHHPLCENRKSQRSIYLCPPSAGIKNVHYHTSLVFDCLLTALWVILYVRESKGAGQRQAGALAFNIAQAGTLKEALARSICLYIEGS